MKHAADDTIAAIATPLGEGGVGVIRISGPAAKQVLSRLFISSNGSNIDSHRMLFGWLIDPETNQKVDQVLACYMAAPKTYTGEDVIEFFCHGSPAVSQKVLELAMSSGARLASRGEFTKRSFLKGKIDLAQAEAVLDLVKARSQKSAGYAINQLAGRLSKQAEELRQKLLAILAELEAEIDFEDDLPEMDRRKLAARLHQQAAQIQGLIASAGPGRLFRQGLAAVIIGKPNVGKSSLLNALLGEDRAIVTESPGTTRDAVEEGLEINGLAVRLIDTAGIRKPKGRAEEAGIERAQKELKAADLALVVLDISRPLDDLDKQVLAQTRGLEKVLVLNKVDLGMEMNLDELARAVDNSLAYKVSALYGQGMAELKQGLVKATENQLGLDDNSVIINARHQECLERALRGLKQAQNACQNGLEAELITIDLKESIVALGEIAGELVSEEVINMIFDQFCVGK